jgi:Rad3-related DNA helicase
MDFSNEKARCVVITGIPFAPMQDSRVSALNFDKLNLL